MTAKPSFIDLSSTYSIGGQTVDFQVTIDPLREIQLQMLFLIKELKRENTLKDLILNLKKK